MWTVLPVSAEGLPEDAAATFHSLLESDLAQATQARMLRSPQRCADVPCAQAAGQAVGARLAVYTLLRPLGARYIASATVVEVGTGQVLATKSATVEHVDELDKTAQKLTARLMPHLEGSVDRGPRRLDGPDSLPPPRRDPRSLEPMPPVPPRDGEGYRDGWLPRRQRTAFFLLGGGAVVPTTSNGFAGLGTGVAFDMGIWIERPQFSIEPRLGFRIDTAEGRRGSYIEVPFDIAAHALFDAGDITPVIGGGLGLHYIRERYIERLSIGRSIVTEHQATTVSSGWGPALFGRAGVLFFRTHGPRLLLSAEYNTTFLDLREGPVSQSFILGASCAL